MIILMQARAVMFFKGGNSNGTNSGDDTLSGGSGADYLYGEDGNDTLRFSVDGQLTSGFRW